jgi:ariadne-1
MLASKVQEGFSDCMSATCPQHKCNVRVTHSLFEKLLEGDDLKAYEKWFVKSYTDDNKNVRWCPFKGCDYISISNLGGFKDVNCLCGNSFCFACGNELHKPCSCEVLKKWSLKNESESENVTWILANTKACPGCKKLIEKNQGCNHMTCSQCKYEFCWLCMVEWKAHDGSSFKCNKFEEAKSKGEELKVGGFKAMKDA